MDRTGKATMQMQFVQKTATRNAPTHCKPQPHRPTQRLLHCGDQVHLVAETKQKAAMVSSTKLHGQLQLTTVKCKEVLQTKVRPTTSMSKMIVALMTTENAYEKLKTRQLAMHSWQYELQRQMTRIQRLCNFYRKYQYILVIIG